MKNIFILALILLAINESAFSRIVNRKVKEAPKVCAMMNQDQLLSKDQKQVFGTLKHSVVIEDNVSVLNDLGKKECQWDFQKLNIYGNIAKFNYYIDEYKNYIYPHLKGLDNKYTILKISLTTCEIEESVVSDTLQFPKCEKPKSKKSKSSKKRGVAKN